MPSWRQVETAIVHVLRGEGYKLTHNPNSGDKILEVSDDSLNITEFAIALAALLEEPANVRSKD